MKDKSKKSSKKEKPAPVTATVARVTEITSSSTISFEDAIDSGIDRACRTLQNVTGAWVQEQKVDVRDGKIASYRVNMKVTFVLRD